MNHNDYHNPLYDVSMLEPELAEDFLKNHEHEYKTLEGVNNKLNMMATMVRGVCESQFHGFIIQGEKGIGKSHVTHKVLDEYDPTVPGNEELLEEKRRSIRRYTGKITPLQLFLALQEWNTSKCILVFDDCDSAWSEVDALNVLKAAMQSTGRRVVTWATTSRLVREQSFEFHGQVIVITNAGFTSKHYKAFLDRVHKFPLRLTREEKMVKIREIAMSDPRYDRKITMDVMSHIQSHIQMIGERLSMRTYENVVELTKLPMWQELAIQTVYSNLEE